MDVVQVLLQQRRKLETYLRRLVACPDTAADIAQDAVIRVWQRRERLSGSNPTGYLFRTARNLSIDHMRAAAVQRDYVTRQQRMPAAAPPTPEAEVAARQELRVLQDALLRLSPRTREIFLLNRVEGRTYAQIARSLGITESAVEKHMLRALRHCRDALASAD